MVVIGHWGSQGRACGAARQLHPQAVEPHADRFADIESAPIMPDAAIIAALTIRSSGIASWVLSPISIVRQGRSPQTVQHLLAPTRAPSHSSNGLPATQMRLDSDGST
jgi:hypothetical protein